MSGSDESGEEMQSGRTNRAENRTKIWAQRNEDEQFDGAAIFVVDSAMDIEDDDFRQVSDGQEVHGIMSSGCGKGAGVVGFNRANPIDIPGEELSNADLGHTKSVGVFGKGVTGVVGQGDSRGYDISDGFGVGVVGRGSKGGPGVVGFAGGVNVEFHATQTGVFGQGATGVTGRGIGGAGVRGTGGELQTGVVGVGGEGKDPVGNLTQGPGVVGVGRGDSLFPPHEPTMGTGVYGFGQDGVRGVGNEGRGGVFKSAQVTAQVRLVPVQVKQMRREPPLISMAVPIPALPKTGVGGDLMSVRVVDKGPCTLWFCVSEGVSGGPARWAQVLLGPLFDGTA